MSKKNIYRPISLLASLIITIGIIAQEEIILNPAELVPHDNGYYVSGVWVDENEDGVDEFHNGCDDYYEDEPDGSPDWFYKPYLNHEETGEQQGFKYFNCMIMPTCDHKSEPIDPPVPTGYIQMHACMYSGTDSAIISYIQTPQVQNLTSIFLEISTDVSIGDHRTIVYNIEYSKDNGESWEAVYLQDNVLAQGGHRVTFDGSVNLEIQDMIDASKVGPIVLRIITNDRGSSPEGQFIKLHSLKITAEEVSSIDNPTVSMLNIQTQNLSIISEKEKIEVYNIMGQFIGTGNLVEVPTQGIYLVRSENSPAQKILVK